MNRQPAMRREAEKCSTRRALLAAASLAAFAAAGASAGDEARLEEIIVTARKLPERLGSLPLAVDVLGAAAEGSARIDGIQSISGQAPGFGYEAQFGASYGVPMLRGQSQPTAAGDNVAVFIDGVYQANRDTIDIETLDFDRIELIRGPQSTLFGHSAFAGALNYVSQRPTRKLSGSATMEGGTDGWLGAQGHLSGAFGSSDWLGRIAASYRRADGTLDDVTSANQFGAFEREAVSGMLSRDTGDSDDSDDWYAELGFRIGSNSASHPAVSRLSGEDYNCGSQSTTSGLWSYYCGRAPVAKRYDLSDDLPDSTSRHEQVLLHISVPVATFSLESDSSVYWGEGDSVRDVDASSTGQTFGVCVVGRSCPAPGIPTVNVERLAGVNEVDSLVTDARELSQEFRLRGGDGRLSWLVGAAWFETELTATYVFGAARGDLAPDERYTALLPGSPDGVGPEAWMVNSALTDNPSTVRFEMFRDEWQRRTLAGFAAVDWRPKDALAVRVELRQTREQFRTRSITAFFAPNTDPQPPAQYFDYTDPRLSVDYAWTAAVHTWLSAARGSRSGGINNTPGLDPAEQSFEPEYNWTYELGLRVVNKSELQSLAITGYYIDWRNTQIGSWSVTPGVDGWVTTNAPGVTTRGIEASITLQPTAWLRTVLDYSHVDASFDRGTDYPGVGEFCGLSPTSNESNICALGLPRQPAPEGISLVPWVDGNELARVPPTSWHAALIIDPEPDLGGWNIGMRADVSYQDDIFENQIESLRFGERTLLDLQLWAMRGAWSMELWGRNVADERYIRSTYENNPGLFLTMPIPVDPLYGDGRRLGLTIRYAN